MPRLLASALLLAATLLAGCGTTVVNPVTGQAERTVMDERTELAEGKKAHDEVLKEYGVYKDERLQAYVNEVGQKLAKQSHRANIPWTFTVLDSPEINAFALPGGYVYVTRGIMAYLDSEADLAGVIGHEIGHVTARHGAQRATRQQTAGIGVIAASVLGQVLGVGNLAGQVAQSAAAGYVASYSRDQELQADQLGAEYLARNRYNPSNMVDVIGVLKDQERFAADAAKAEGKAAPSGSKRDSPRMRRGQGSRSSSSSVPSWPGRRGMRPIAPIGRISLFFSSFFTSFSRCSGLRIGRSWPRNFPMSS